MYNLKEQLDGLQDGRISPRIKTPVAAGSALVMALAQMGSLNALEQTGGNSFWRKWLGAPLPSADVMGTVFSSIDCSALGGILRHLYARLKRNRALRPNYMETAARRDCWLPYLSRRDTSNPCRNMLEPIQQWAGLFFSTQNRSLAT